MQYEINVLVSGRPIDVYNHAGSTYVEGRAKSEYKLQLKNNTSADAEFIVSIDGLSIIDGKPAGKNSTGYIVKAWQTSVIDGWLVDKNTAAKFVFGSKGSSYAASIGQDTDNTGVIGLQVFAKKAYPIFNSMLSYPSWETGFLQNEWYPHSIKTIATNVQRSYLDAGQASFKNLTSLPLAKGICQNQVQSSLTSGYSGPISGASASVEPVQSSLATEFGAATDFKTSKVEFERASTTPVYTQAIYYATAPELNKLGIVLKWQKVKTKTPNPFPADTYCKTPDGWKK